MGTFVSASIEGRAIENILRVPRHALRGSDQLLFVDDDSKLRIRNVSVLRADTSYAYLDGGAAPGERVILTTMESPINGLAVRTMNDPPPQSEPDDEKLASKLDDQQP